MYNETLEYRGLPHWGPISSESEFDLYTQIDFVPAQVEVLPAGLIADEL